MSTARHRDVEPGLRGTVRLLRALPDELAPKGFVRAVRRRIRRRGLGRSADVDPARGLVVAASFNVVLLAVLAVLYLVSIPVADPTPTPSAPHPAHVER